MIFGGDSANDKEKSLELFNWETWDHCKLGNLPYGVAGHSGTVMNGIPVFCGGYSSHSSSWCFKYNIQSKEWEQVKKLFHHY